jgi:hypothetical protein
LKALKDDPDGRPEGRAGLPPRLYHAAFTQFQVSLHDTSNEFSSEFLSLVAEFMDTCTQVFPNEKFRFKALKPLLDKLLTSEFVNLAVGDAKADGTILTNVPDGPIAFRAMWELKNEIGCGGSDPVTQVSYSYRKYWGS